MKLLGLGDIVDNMVVTQIEKSGVTFKGADGKSIKISLKEAEDFVLQHLQSPS